MATVMAGFDLHDLAQVAGCIVTVVVIAIYALIIWSAFMGRG